MKYLLIGAALICAVAAASAFYAFQRPDFMVGFIAAAVAAIVSAAMPFILKTYRFEKQWRQSFGRGEQWDARRHRPKDSK